MSRNREPGTCNFLSVPVAGTACFFFRFLGVESREIGVGGGACKAE